MSTQLVAPQPPAVPAANAQPGLPGAFIAYLAANPSILAAIRDFQSCHRVHFIGQARGEEYTAQQHDSHLSFLALVEFHLHHFLQSANVREDDFAAALLDLKIGQDPHWKAFDMLLNKVDFEGFVDMLRSDICLCCGGRFQAQAAVASTSSATVPNPLLPELPSSSQTAAPLPPLEDGSTAGACLGGGDSAPGLVQVQVIVPDGVTAGQSMRVAYEGQMFEAVVPDGCNPGMAFTVTIAQALSMN